MRWAEVAWEVDEVTVFGGGGEGVAQEIDDRKIAPREVLSFCVPLPFPSSSGLCPLSPPYAKVKSKHIPSKINAFVTRLFNSIQFISSWRGDLIQLQTFLVVDDVFIRPCHTAAILSRETKRALFYHAKPHPHDLHCEAWRGKTKLFWSPGQYGRRVTRANCIKGPQTDFSHVAKEVKCYFR